MEQDRRFGILDVVASWVCVILHCRFRAGGESGYLRSISVMTFGVMRLATTTALASSPASRKQRSERGSRGAGLDLRRPAAAIRSGCLDPGDCSSGSPIGRARLPLTSRLMRSWAHCLHARVDSGISSKRVTRSNQSACQAVREALRRPGGRRHRANRGSPPLRPDWQANGQMRPVAKHRGDQGRQHPAWPDLDKRRVRRPDTSLRSCRKSHRRSQMLSQPRGDRGGKSRVREPRPGWVDWPDRCGCAADAERRVGGSAALATIGVGNALETGSSTPAIPRRAASSIASVTAATGPAMTVCAGPFPVGGLNSRTLRMIASTSEAPARSAAIAPLPDSTASFIKRPRSLASSAKPAVSTTPAGMKSDQLAKAVLARTLGSQPRPRTRRSIARQAAAVAGCATSVSMRSRRAVFAPGIR